MANRITTLFDLDAKGFDAGLKNLRTKIAETDGTFNKMKVGAKGTFDSIQANAGAVALGAGAALVAFGVKAVGAFTDTAKAAIDGAAATGLNTEQMSRWIAVGDDFQISADQLVTGLGKIGKTLDSGKWEKYGVATRDAGGHARDVNDVLLDSLDMLGKIGNETERNRVGNDLFGRGYANLAPLVGKTRAEYEKYLGSVEKGQVITAEEAKKAEKTRLAMDNLHDTVQELTLAFGQSLAPELAETANDLADVVAVAQELGDTLNGIPDMLGLGGGGGLGITDAILGAVDPVKTIHNVKVGLNELGDTFGLTSDKAADLGPTFDQVASSADDAKGAFAHAKSEAAALNDATDKGNSAFQVYAGNVQHAAEATDRKAKADEKAKADADKYRASLDAVSAAMEAQRSAALELVGGDIGVREAQRQAKKAADELNDTLDDQSTTLADAGAAIDDAAQSQLDAASAAAEYRAQQMEANGETVDANTKAQLFKEELQKLADGLNGPLAAAIQNYIDQLGAIPSTVATTIVLNKPGRVGDINPFIRTNGARAAGGPTYPGLHRVLERGPELLRQGGQTFLMSNGGGQVVPMSAGVAGGSPGGQTNYITVHAGLGADGRSIGREIITAIKREERFSGPGWRQ